MKQALPAITKSLTACTGTVCLLPCLPSALTTAASFALCYACVRKLTGILISAVHMCRHKLEPMVTLHHFVHPNWFERLGGFTKEANIPIFVEFAQTAFRYQVHGPTSLSISNVSYFIPTKQSSVMSPPARHIRLAECIYH